ncbi:MAG: hypothetical protein IPL75_18430 [Acidobacteria bacterium]|nr:hypothetical protein [Acidobacteriota bacterium]
MVPHYTIRPAAEVLALEEQRELRAIGASYVRRGRGAAYDAGARRGPGGASAAGDV